MWCCDLHLWLKQCWYNTLVLRVAEQYFHSVNAFSLPHPSPAMSRLGVSNRLERENWPQLMKVNMFSNKRPWKGGRMGGHSCLWFLSSQATVMHAEALLLGNCPDICLIMGSSEWISLSTLLTWAPFAFPLKLSLSWSMSLLAFLLFSPHPLGGGSGREAGAAFGFWPTSAHLSNGHNAVCESTGSVCIRI